MTGLTHELARLGLDPLALLLAVCGLIAVLLVALLVAALIAAARRRTDVGTRTAQAAAMERELVELRTRLQSMAEVAVTRQSELSRAVNERLDRVSQRMGQNLTDTANRTSESLSKLNERLAVIDTAQKNITELSSNVMTLQEVLANKQSRGAFGEGRMQAIIADGLPREAYTFQATLSNGRRPDCLIHMPSAPPIVIDAKFPLEGFEGFRLARDEAARKQAARTVQTHVGHHIAAIAERYLLSGETQDTALMFVPSETIYADLHEHFAGLIQTAYRARIVIVSPNMLMLAVQTLQAILKDVRMREQAGQIQTQVARLMEDVGRLHERVVKLQNHFGMATKDVEMILTSSSKISKHGRRIETLDFEEPAPANGPALSDAPRRASNGTGAGTAISEG